MEFVLGTTGRIALPEICRPGTSASSRLLLVGTSGFKLSRPASSSQLRLPEVDVLRLNDPKPAGHDTHF